MIIFIKHIFKLFSIDNYNFFLSTMLKIIYYIWQEDFINIIDIITKKRDKYKLSENEIKFVIDSYVNEEISDAQMSALLMAIYINGMDGEETAY